MINPTGGRLAICIYNIVKTPVLILCKPLQLHTYCWSYEILLLLKYMHITLPVNECTLAVHKFRVRLCTHKRYAPYKVLLYYRIHTILTTKPIKEQYNTGNQQQCIHEICSSSSNPIVVL